MQNLLSLLPSLLISLLACTVGALLMRFVFVKPSLKSQLCFGAVIGFVSLAWIGFLLALVAGLNWFTIGVTVAILAMMLVLFLQKELRRNRTVGMQESAASADQNTPQHAVSSLRFNGKMVLSLGWVIFFCWLFSRVIMMEPDGLHTAPANNYGDLAFHFSVVTSFADGDNFPPRNPIFQGLKFTYPFLIDFLAAFLHKTGADWATAFFIPNLILTLALIGIIELLTAQLARNALATHLAPILFFLSGGLGFIYFARDWQKSESNWLDFLLHLPASYTKNDELSLQWGNMLTTLIVPQRSLLFGIPVFAMIVILWAKSFSLTDDSDLSPQPLRSLPPRRFYLLTAGILAGLMPLLHAHGFFSIMMVSAAMALLFFSWDWLAFFVPAAVLAFPQALWLSGTGTKSSLFKPHFGWAAGETSFLKFTALNFGLFLVLLAVSLVWREARIRRFYWPFLLCFIVPNLVLLAPWPWDNIKVFLYWYLVSCPIVAALLAQLLKRRMILWPTLGGVLLVVLVLSGALDVWRSLSPIENLRLFEADQLKVAELIKQHVPPQALVLSAPIHNSVLALSGRQMVMGYPGHLWSHGIQFADRERDIKTMYLGGIDAMRLFRAYGIDYVIVGPVEYTDFNADEGFFAATYQAVVDEAGYRVYQIPR